MGKSYWFECARCGYRAKVAGRGDRGLNFFVQTIVCRDCRQLYDAVTRLKIPDDNKKRRLSIEMRRLGSFYQRRPAQTSPPHFEAVLNRLPYKGVKHFRWQNFKLQC